MFGTDLFIRLAEALPRAVVPDALWPGVERQRRARIVGVACALVVAAGTVRAVTFLGGGSVGQAGVFFFAAGVAALLLIMVRRRKSLNLAGHGLIAVITVTATATAVHRGGFGSPMVIALGLVPVLATLVAGIQGGLYWTLFILTDVTALGLVALSHGPLADQVPLESRFSVDLVASLVLPLVAFGIASAHTWATEEAVAARLRSEHSQAMAEAESRQLRADRMAWVGGLAAGLAHEINNPLACAIANMEFIADRIGADGDGDELRDAIDETVGSLSRVAAISRDLEVLTPSDDNPVGPVDVNVVIATALRLVKSELESMVLVDTDLRANLPAATGNDGVVLQIILSLIRNATAAMTSPTATHRIYVVTGLHGSDQIVIEIRDTGSGMTGDVLARAHTPFFTTGGGSSMGLGLSVASKVVSELGGKLELSSTEGQGTVARLTLPTWSGQADLRVG